MKMRSIILSFAFIFIGTSLMAQQDDTLFVRYDSHSTDSVEYITDTLFRKTSFGPHFLFETEWITNTRDQLDARGFGLLPSTVESECIDKGIEAGENKIITLIKTDSSIVANYKVATNCCFAFLCDMEIIDSTILNLKYIDYGTLCGCTCYHHLLFEIDLEFLRDEYEINFGKLKFITLNGQLKAKLE
jgi:hypothetical protein